MRRFGDEVGAMLGELMGPDRASSRLEAAPGRYVVALYNGHIATETATIRVTRETRDRLAEQARERGVSLASMLADLARAAEREAVFRGEREAARTDGSSPEVRAEERAWETALGDGID